MNRPMIELAMILDAGLPNTWQKMITVDDIVTILGVNNRGSAYNVIRYHRRHLSNATEALLCYRNYGGWYGYWLSADPDEIAEYGQARWRGLHTQTSTMLAIADRAVSVTRGNTAEGREARQRQAGARAIVEMAGVLAG